jgi:hypothetical protein
VNQSPFTPPRANVDAPAQEAAADVPRILSVAARQKHVLWLLLINILFAKAQIGSLYLAIALGIVFAIAIYRLAGALELNYQFLYPLLGLVPLINLVMLFYVNRKATLWLKDNGVMVGLLGASSSELRNLELQRL